MPDIDATNLPSSVTDIQVDAMGHGFQPGDRELDRPVQSMTDREIAEETLIIQRRTRDTVQEFVAGLQSNPMIQGLMNGKSPLSAMFGGRG